MERKSCIKCVFAYKGKKKLHCARRSKSTRSDFIIDKYQEKRTCILYRRREKYSRIKTVDKIPYKLPELEDFLTIFLYKYNKNNIGNIYILKTNEKGIYKIGKAKDYERRYKQLKNYYYGYNLSEFFVQRNIISYHFLEKELHHHFCKNRIDPLKELFKLSKTELLEAKNMIRHRLQESINIIKCCNLSITEVYKYIFGDDFRNLIDFDKSTNPELIISTYQSLLLDKKDTLNIFYKKINRISTNDTNLNYRDRIRIGIGDELEKELSRFLQKVTKSISSTEDMIMDSTKPKEITLQL